MSSSSIKGAGANDSLKIPALQGQQDQWRHGAGSILKPIYDGDKRMAAEIVERAKARQIYNEIVRRQIDPGLLEYAGKGSKQTIEQRLGLL